MSQRKCDEVVLSVFFQDSDSSQRTSISVINNRPSPSQSVSPCSCAELFHAETVRVSSGLKTGPDRNLCCEVTVRSLWDHCDEAMEDVTLHTQHWRPADKLWYCTILQSHIKNAHVQQQQTDSKWTH